MSVSGSSYSSDNNLGGKRCSECGIVKDADAFYRHQYTPDGLGYKCKECISIKNKTNYQTRKDQNGSNDALYIFEHPLIPGLIKIGRSDCPPSRAKQMSVSYPYELVVKHMYPTFGSLELRVHNRLDARRATGGGSREWFWTDSSLADRIIHGIIAEHELSRSTASVLPLLLPAW